MHLLRQKRRPEIKAMKWLHSFAWNRIAAKHCNMLHLNIITKIYLSLYKSIGGQRTINNTFCTLCIESVLLYNISNLWPKPLLQHLSGFELYPYCFVSHSIWYCCKHPNELCTPAYSSVTLVLGLSATTLKNSFLTQLIFLNSNWNLI